MANDGGSLSYCQCEVREEAGCGAEGVNERQMSQRSLYNRGTRFASRFGADIREAVFIPLWRRIGGSSITMYHTLPLGVTRAWISTFNLKISNYQHSHRIHHGRQHRASSGLPVPLPTTLQIQVCRINDFKYVSSIIIHFTLAPHIFQVFHRAEAKHHSYYVLMRGIIPGIYTDVAEVLRNVAGVEGAYVEEFPTWQKATVSWRQALRDFNVVPLDSFVPPTFSPLIFEKSAGSSAFFEGSHGHSSVLHESFAWHRSTHDSGSKWVVMSGRVPGIYDSW